MPLPFSRRALATAPSFSRDFAGLKTLDHGVGPAITFTRASDATYFDASGTLQTASNDTPRFDHDPATGASRGLLIEEARTNSIRNSQAGGSTNGVIGSGGVAPTNWNWPGLATVTSHGVAIEIIGTGTESGLAYIDVKISGTPTGTEFVYINPDSLTQVSASNGQSWTFSSYVKLQAGAVTNTTIRNVVSGLTAAGASISGQNLSSSFVPTSSALNTQRRSVSHAFTSASVERANGLISVAYTNGNQIGGSADGFTLRIAAPQLEQGAFPTSYIPTTSAAATRAADSAVVTPISSFYNQSEGTLFGEATFNAPSNFGTTQLIADINDTSGSNRLRFGRNATDNVAAAFLNTAGSSVVAIGGSSAIAASVLSKLGFAFKNNDFALYGAGALVGTDFSGSLPLLTHLRLGSSPTGDFPLNGHIRRIAYYPRRLSNTLLQQLTT